MKEQYLPIPGYPDYKVSNFGNVYSIRNDIILKPKKHSKGYLKVQLNNSKQFFIHRLVLITFIGEPPKGRPQTRHLDDDKTNNKLSNLRWGSQSENEDDKRYVGTYHLRANCYA